VEVVEVASEAAAVEVASEAAVAAAAVAAAAVTATATATRGSRAPAVLTKLGWKRYLRSATTSGGSVTLIAPTGSRMTCARWECGWTTRRRPGAATTAVSTAIVSAAMTSMRDEVGFASADAGWLSRRRRRRRRRRGIRWRWRRWIRWWWRRWIRWWWWWRLWRRRPLRPDRARLPVCRPARHQRRGRGQGQLDDRAEDAVQDVARL
jgi:hypothetical protein